MVFDYNKIEIKQPKDIVPKVLTYSRYKCTDSANILVSQIPGGLISYISPTYGGKASDTQITKQSKLLGKFIPHVESVTADKGFLIRKLCKKKKQHQNDQVSYANGETAHCRGSCKNSIHSKYPSTC